MCTKPFSQTQNKGKLFWVAKSSGPLLARMPLNSHRMCMLHNQHEYNPNTLLTKTYPKNTSLFAVF